MILDISRDITRSLVENDIIDFDDFPSYQYGVELLLITLIENIGLLLIALIFRMLPEFIVFILAFSPLRLVAGGYHSKTVMRCFLSFVVIAFLGVFFTGFMQHETHSWLSVVVSLVAYIIYLWKAPVAVANRPITNGESRHFRKLTLRLSTVYVLIIAGCSIFNTWNWHIGIFSYGMLFEAISLLLEDCREGYSNETSCIENC